MSRNIYACLLIGCAILPSKIAHADHWSCCGNPIAWGSSNVDLKWSTVSFSAGSPWVDRIEDAADGWSALSESSFVWQVAPDSNSDVGHGNGENEIWFTNASNSINAGAIALISYSLGQCPGGPCCNGCTPPTILETDIILYGKTKEGFPVTWYHGVPNGSFPIGTTSSGNWVVVTVQHELGHALGLTHPLVGLARMCNSGYFSGGWFHTGSRTVVPFGHDRASVKILYPRSSSYTDVIVHNVQGTEGSHPSTSWPLSYNIQSGDFDYYPRSVVSGSASVRMGEQVEARFCRGNLGPKRSSSVSIDVYLSTDPRWSSNDKHAGTFGSERLAGYARGCFTGTFTIPSGLTVGERYYVLYGYGTSGNNMANMDRRLRIVQ